MLVSDDKNLVEVTARWSDAAVLGCRLKIKSFGEQPDQSDSWQNIGSAAARVVRKVGARE
jgi:hypothetical protein